MHLRWQRRGGSGGEGAPRTLKALLHDGAARFDRLALALRLQLTVDADDPPARSAPLMIRGPTVEGDTIHADVALPPPWPIMHGQLVDAAGEPIRNRTPWLSFPDPTGEVAGAKEECLDRTDAEGHFTLAATPERRALRPRFADIVLPRRRGEAEGDRFVRIPWPATLPAGNTDLGRLTARALPVVASGTVTSPAGQPIHAQVTLEVARSGPNGESWTDSVATTTTNEHGAFQLRSRATSGILRLRVEGLHGGLTNTLHEVRAGTRDARLVVAPR
ncbi:MAG: carboxypeptidase-like regulatory domain-containing protein [Planctomycetota bacterium]